MATGKLSPFDLYLWPFTESQSHLNQVAEGFRRRDVLAISQSGVGSVGYGHKMDEVYGGGPNILNFDFLLAMCIIIIMKHANRANHWYPHTAVPVGSRLVGLRHEE